MKKYVAMFALGLAIAVTANAQNTPQPKSGENPDKHNGTERTERKNKSEFRRNSETRKQLSPEERATRRTERLSKKLELSDQQHKQLQALNLKQVQEMDALRSRYQNPEEGKKERRQEIQRLHANWEKELKSILDKNQYAKYEEARKEMQARRRDRTGKDGENGARFRKS